jgi:hypothetical protein
MPRDVSLRKTFLENFGPKAQPQRSDKPAAKKKPKKRKQTFKELRGERSIRMEIAYAAMDRRHVIIRYKKATTREVKRYMVAPYSYRFRRAKRGRMKALYAYDADDRSIKSFYVANIKGIEPTLKPFRPKWTIEIA